MSVYTLTPAPTAQMFPMEDRVEGEWLALRLAFLRSGITGETEEVMSVLCPSGRGFGGSRHPPPPSPISPGSAGTGIHFECDRSLQGNSVPAQECRDGCVRYGSDSKRGLLMV